MGRVLMFFLSLNLAPLATGQEQHFFQTMFTSASQKMLGREWDGRLPANPRCVDYKSIWNVLAGTWFVQHQDLKGESEGLWYAMAYPLSAFTSIEGLSEMEPMDARAELSRRFGDSNFVYENFCRGQRRWVMSCFKRDDQDVINDIGGALSMLNARASCTEYNGEPCEWVALLSGNEITVQGQAYPVIMLPLQSLVQSGVKAANQRE